MAQHAILSPQPSTRMWSHRVSAAWVRDSERSERQQAIHWLGEAEAEGAAGPLDTSDASRPTSAGESPEASSTP